MGAHGVYFLDMFLLFIFIGAKESNASAIVGGSSSFPGQNPWAVSISLSGQYQCTGLLVAEDWILTSASCPCALSQLSSFVQVTAGDFSLIDEDDGEIALQVLQSFPHTDYDSERNLNNIALLQLSGPVELSDVIQVAKIDDTFKNCSLVGWGSSNTEDNQGKSDVLQTLQVLAEPSINCQNSSYNFNINDEMRCIFPPNDTQGFGACSNDFGTNLVCINDEGSKTVDGIVTHFDVHTCGDVDHPTVITSLSVFSQWIEDNIQKDSCHGVHLPEKEYGHWECQVDGEGKFCNLLCTPTYENIGGSRVVCDENGWVPSPDSLYCEEISCPTGYEKINHRCYTSPHQSKYQPWLSAMKTCEMNSATLVQFSSQEELHSVSYVFRSEEFWTFANDWEEESMWRWGFTDLAVSPGVWENQEEDSLAMNCAFFIDGNMWQGECKTERRFICEKSLGK